MARIRSIKPEVRISEKVNSWPIECRYFWVLLWGYCDDYGIGRDNPRLIVADSFPLDDTITAKKVSGWMDTIWNSGVIERYTVDGNSYFQVTSWDEHQKISHPAKQFLPDISQASAILRRVTESDQSFTEAFEKASPKQGAVSREQGAVSSEQVMAPMEPKPNLTDLFASAYASWPKRVKEEDARSRFMAACQKQDPIKLAYTIAQFGMAYRDSTEMQFIPALGPWLYQKRWSDALPIPEEADRPKMTAAQKNLDVVAQFQQLEAQREIES